MKVSIVFWVPSHRHIKSHLNFNSKNLNEEQEISQHSTYILDNAYLSIRPSRNLLWVVYSFMKIIIKMYFNCGNTTCTEVSSLFLQKMEWKITFFPVLLSGMWKGLEFKPTFSHSMFMLLHSRTFVILFPQR